LTIRQDFLSYQVTISNALKLEQNRIRHLIGDKHWPTDGEYKEQILRDVISDFIPEVYRVGSGFVCYPEIQSSSGQLDILITSTHYPTLYKQGNLHFVTADAARAIIEVKTKISRDKKLNEVVEKLCSQIEKIRKIYPKC